MESFIIAEVSMSGKIEESFTPPSEILGHSYHGGGTTYRLG